MGRQITFKAQYSNQANTKQIFFSGAYDDYQTVYINV